MNAASNNAELMFFKVLHASRPAVSFPRRYRVSNDDVRRRSFSSWASARQFANGLGLGGAVPATIADDRSGSATTTQMRSTTASNPLSKRSVPPERPSVRSCHLHLTPCFCMIRDAECHSALFSASRRRKQSPRAAFVERAVRGDTSEPIGWRCVRGGVPGSTTRRAMMSVSITAARFASIVATRLLPLRSFR